MKPFRLEFAVFLVALLVLSCNLWNVGIASGTIDPVLHYGSQDEATYTREAIAMARDGNWMTPTFLGRWVFEKPPLLMWLCALSLTTFGIAPLTARLPVVFAGALVCLFCFSIVRRARSVTAGLVAAALVLSSQIVFTMARRNMTDILLTAATLAAVAILSRDPSLHERRSQIGFVVAVAAAITAKSVAGILPLGILGLLWLGNRRATGLTLVRVLTISVAAVALASPWFIYNLVFNRNWFLADMGFQLITTGSGAHQTSNENHLWFYVLRIFRSDLLPLVLALTAIPALAVALRRRESPAWIATAYCVVYGAALIVFRYHSQQYLCWFVPSLILIGTLYSPVLKGKGAVIALAVAACLFIVKAANPESTWGISISPGTTIAAAPVLSQYCTENRASDLYVLGVDDEFYSAALPLHHVHYAWIDPNDVVAREHPYLTYMGVLISAAEIAQLPQMFPVYAQRLREWGVTSTQAIATGFAVHDNAELLALIRSHPESDFLVAKSILPDPAQQTTHRVAFQNADFALLEASSVNHEPAPWTCRM